MATESNEIDGRAGWRAHVESVEQLVMNVAFVVLLGAIGWGVVSRHVVTTPSAWVEEVSALAYCWLIFIGAAEVHRRGQHVSVDLLTSVLPDRVRRALSLAVEAGVVGLCIYIAWLGARQTIASHSSTTSMLRMPLSLGFAGLTAGFMLMAGRGAQRLARQLARPDGGR